MPATKCKLCAADCEFGFAIRGLKHLSEGQPKLSLEGSVIVVLVGNVPEIVCRVETQRGVVDSGMIEDIRGVKSNLNGFRFADAERFANVGIEVPGSGILDGLTSDRAAISRLRILEKDVA